MMIDLTARQRDLVHRIVRSRLPGQEVRVFGSRATGDSKPWSDLDLAILGEQPVDDRALAEARADFEESDLPFRVDLTPWSDLPAALQQTIARSSQPL